MIACRYVASTPGWMGRCQEGLANSPTLRSLRRKIFRHIPFPVLASDVRDVLYANWLVPVEAVASLVPPEIELTDIDGTALLTVLSYRHHHFGPALAGPLRVLFPSPLQSNWRLYVRAVRGRTPPRPTVLFIRNIFDQPLYAVGTRLFSDALPSLLAGRFKHQREAGTWETTIDDASGAGDIVLVAEECDRPALPQSFASFASDWAEAIRRICLQDAAIAHVGDIGRLARGDIDLPIDPVTARPLHVLRYEPGPSLRNWGATAEPFCFGIPAVRFRVLGEQLI
jgi:hypothetical protein